jgi:hypothetical protein
LKGKYHKQKKQQGAGVKIIGVDEIASAAIAARSDPEDQEKHIKNYVQPRDPIVNWWLLLATIVIAIIYGLQLNAMLESNNINRNALESVQRAVVTFSPKGEIATRVEHGKVVSWSLEIPITNQGATATKQLRDRGNLYISAKDMPKDFDFPDTGAPDQGILGPKDTTSYEPEPIPISAVQAVQSGTGYIYVYGWASYDDAFFPQTKPHRTEFCYQLSLNSIAGDVASLSYNLPGRLMSCHRHNCSDEDCEDKKPN